MNLICYDFYQILKDWQTLVAALLALLAAIVTIRVMRHQAVVDDQRHQNQMRRKEMAARAQMPDALSEMSGYVREAGKYLTGQSENVPDAPTSSIAALKQVIEHIDDDAAQRAFELVSWYQVQRARTSGKAASLLGTAEPLYDVVLLQAYANSLFDYARNEVNSP